MATIYPSPLPKHYRREPEQRAEIPFYEYLNQSLGKEYRIFNDVVWQSRTDHGRDGQADFVLAHPRHGVRMLEFKGGQIGHNSASGSWWCIDKIVV